MCAKKLTRRVLDICDEALALSGEECEAHLREACGEEAELRSHVDRLLQAVEDSGRFLLVRHQGSSD